MTENQSEYLADLALQKGVKVDASVDRSASWTSQEIERLKSLPDANFQDITDQQIRKISALASRVLTEMNAWTLE